MFLALVLSLAPTTFPDGVVDQLNSLESVDAGQRRQAQRWLAVNLTPGDYPAVAAAASWGRAETFRRLAQALGTDNRHLELAALLATDSLPEVARLGERALVEQLLRWSSSAMDQPHRRRRLPDEWVDDWPRALSMDPEQGGLAGALERLDRLGGGPAPLVLDPALDPKIRSFVPDRELSTEPLEGSWTRVLLDLARAHQVSFEVHGRRTPGDEGAGDARAWVRVCKRGAEGHASGGELLVGWVRASLTEHDPAGTAAACRALASSGWPAALEWLGRRWMRDGDPAALEGLLLSAARGQVVREFMTLAGVERLLHRADQAPTTDGPAIARALAGIGPFSITGEGLQGALLEGWANLDSPARWVRLVALEGIGFRSEPAASRCAALLGSEAPSWLRRQALRTLARVGGYGPEVAVPERLFEAADDGVEARLLARELVAVGARPMAGWRVASDAPHLTRALWALGVGRVEQAREELGRLLIQEPDVGLMAASLRLWAALGAGEELLQLGGGPAPAGAPASAWRRLVLLSGAAQGATLEAMVSGLLAVEPLPAESLLELGAIATGTGSAATRARQALVRALREGAPVEIILPALEVAVLGLRRARLDVVNDGFQAQLRTTAAREGHPAAARLYAADWPPRPLDLAPRLEDRDRFRH